jgi:hypothetical protein
MVSLVTGVIGVSISVLIIVLIRKDRLHAHHGLGWILVALSFALLGLFPGIIDRLAQIVGIGYPPVLALTLGISLLVIKILLMDIERSKIEMRNQRLIQRVAMLEADLKRLQSPGDAAPSEQRFDS